MTALPGLDLDAFTTFFDAAQPGELAGPVTGRLLAGGQSNLTYEVSDGVHSWVVRRPPLGHVLATAHDMSREYTVMSALQATSVPVPRMYALCADPEVIGAPFYVMEKVDGTPYRYATELAALGIERTAAISRVLVDTLADLHQVDPEQVGLVDFGRPAGFVTRQVRRWKKQLDASRSRPLAGAGELHSLLERDIPVESPPAVVHGDYRIDNVLVDDQDRIAAVIDWEMATLGDPLTDVALLIVYREIADDFLGKAAAASSAAPGFLTSDEMVTRYSQSCDRDLSRLDFYVALAYYKLAVVLEGIHFRYTQGQTVGEGFESAGDTVEALLAAGLDVLASHTHRR